MNLKNFIIIYDNEIDIIGDLIYFLIKSGFIKTK